MLNAAFYHIGIYIWKITLYVQKLICTIFMFQSWKKKTTNHLFITKFQCRKKAIFGHLLFDYYPLWNSSLEWMSNIHKGQKECQKIALLETLFLSTPAKKFLGKECNKYDDENFFANGFSAHLERNKWVKWASEGW